LTEQIGFAYKSIKTTKLVQESTQRIYILW